MNHESEYIRQLAKTVRHGTTSAVYSEWIQRIRDAFSEIADPKIQKEAQRRIMRIGNYSFIHVEDPEGSRALIANELEELANFVKDL